MVRPRVHDIVAPVAVGSRITAESEAPAARSMVSDLGNDFLTLRDYEVGDDLRRVHWRSTARTGELMIRQDEARWRSPRRGGARRPPRRARRGVVRGRGRGGGVGHRAPRAAAPAGRGGRPSAGEMLGTGGDPRHDVIDRLATVSLRDEPPPARVLENLRGPPARRPRRRGPRRRHARHRARARRARRHRRRRGAHPPRARSRRQLARSSSTRRAAPFADRVEPGAHPLRSTVERTRLMAHARDSSPR